MQLLFIKELFGTQLMQAICWTLVHSLWQGLLLAIVAGIIILVTRRSGPQLRYNLLASLLLVFVLIVGGTFIKVWNNSTPLPSTVGTPVPTPSETFYWQPATDPVTTTITSRTPSFTSRLVAYCNEHAAVIVAIWFIIFSARLVKLLAELGTIQRIRHYKTYAPNTAWIQTVETLAVQLQIHRSVQLLESGIVKVPVVIGFLKPVILMPLGLLANLPPDQVEAILLHELAHIKRRDYLVNLLQHFAEMLFFFNPAVLWLSSLIREEREHCCDDMAIAITQNKKQFVHALVAFQQYHLTSTGYAMAFPGKKDHLLNRVKRLVYNNNKTLNAMEKSFLIACLLVTGTLTFVYAQRSNSQPKPSLTTQTVQQNEKAYSHEPEFSNHQGTDQITPTLAGMAAGERQQKDTTPSFRNKYYQPQEVKEGTRFTFTETFEGQPYTGYLAKKEGTLYQFGKQNDKVTFLRINGKDIAPANIASYDAVINELLTSFQPAVKPVDPVTSEQPIAPVQPGNAKVVAISPLVAVDGRTNSITTYLSLIAVGKQVKINKGLSTAGSTTRYYGNEYEVEETGGTIMKVLLDKKELTPEEITQQQPAIQQVIHEAKLEFERGRIEAIKKAEQNAIDEKQRATDEKQRAIDERIKEDKEIKAYREVYEKKLEDQHIVNEEKEHLTQQEAIKAYNRSQKVENQRVAPAQRTITKIITEKELNASLQKIEKLNRELTVEHQKLAGLNATHSIQPQAPVQPQTPQYNLVTPKYKARTEIYKRERTVYDEAFDELVKEGIVKKDATNISIVLNDKKLIVDGVEQSAELHKRIREKYVPNGTWTFTRANNNINHTINKNDHKEK